MGIIWRSIMPLLSTLAALVIIVHSAEEEMNRGYRRDLRPRAVETASYEQPWKAIDHPPPQPPEPVHQPTRAEGWIESLEFLRSVEEVPPRRRPVRKRKRRPLPYPDTEPLERHQESIQAAHTEFHDQTIDAPRRRRKRPEHISYHFTEQPALADDRPLRRRGLRKKRPDYDEQLDDPSQADFDPVVTKLEHHQTFPKYKQFDYDYLDTEHNTEIPEVNVRLETDVTDQPYNVRNEYNNKHETSYNRLNGFQEQNKQTAGASESESISSLEENFDINTKITEETAMKEPKAQSIENATSNPENNSSIMDAINRTKESGAIDPIMLKQLLKRSNGSSLSEMLQRHNLSLTDLLQGRNEAISALNAGGTYEPQQSTDISLESNSKLNEAETKYPARRQTSSKEKKVPTDSNSVEDTEGPKSNGNTENDEPVANKDTTKTENQESKPRISTKRRFPTGIRRKLRMRPTLNSTLKAQLSRDLIALSARKYSNNNKNVTKSREWKDIVPMMPDRSKTDNNEDSKDEVTETAPTTTYDPVETTTSSLKVSNSFYSLSGGKNVSNVKDNEVEKVATTTTEATTTITIEVMPDEIMSEIEKPKITPIVRPNATNSTLRRQAFNNRLKRKRLKQKSSTTENPSDDLMRNFLGMANLVSASQFIERTQKPDTTVKMDNTEFVTELEDFLTTETPPETVDIGVKSTSRFTTSTTPRILAQKSSTSTTEQTAKFEIQEILSDKMTKERLAKILRDRNMTLNELVNHRERGSSHVHLADIFHNASKEPNPPEPFLTKSSIEPISKETYPLRAILEANTYETTTRTLLSQTDQKNILIPVVMNFGNNVNENGESMGIISLFNKIAENEVTIDKTEIRKDSEGTPYLSSIISVNATNANDTNRESRSMGDSEDWNELLSFMKAHNISTFEEDLQTLNKGNTEKESLENLEGDGLMILEDLQNLENFQSDTAIGSGENVEISIQEKRENLSKNAGILNKLPNNTKSVAIATASILGLAAILFLLTYIAFKWKQQRNKMRKKKSFCDGPIPSPVFENRKSNKNNCSSRSISPMISNTNIYMSTLETNSGKESPDYMWNSLRKPFQ
ncbi:uncharacterized protein LOC133525652 isoform X2 [Cydia pomonella]|uniref:uncharacterized protein LOC133525652 isoform X2 n=1 Tax=Cydia pomonella TaxID=82600 RepID=UPI002ADDB151|nr:uncharacterized protein LOC133525652 isoform X2 [Cydia pomonella]